LVSREARIYIRSLHDALPISPLRRVEWRRIGAADLPRSPGLRRVRRRVGGGGQGGSTGVRVGNRGGNATWSERIELRERACAARSEGHTPELQSLAYLVCRLL